MRTDSGAHFMCWFGCLRHTKGHDPSNRRACLVLASGLAAHGSSGRGRVHFMAEQNIGQSTRILLMAALAGMLQIAFVYLTAFIFGVSVGNISMFLGGLVTQDGATAIMIGRIILGAMAIVWGYLFISFARSVKGSWPAKGILYGLLVWGLSTIVILPLLSASMQTPGWTAQPGLFGIGFAGWPGAFLSLGAHIVYGWVLAYLMENTAVWN